MTSLNDLLAALPGTSPSKATEWGEELSRAHLSLLSDIAAFTDEDFNSRGLSAELVARLKEVRQSAAATSGGSSSSGDGGGASATAEIKTAHGFSVGDLVDVQDEIGKWVFGKVAAIDSRAQTEKRVIVHRNCPKCKALIKLATDRTCPVCNETLEAATTDAGNEQMVSSVKFRIEFFGWGPKFDEWVSASRLHQGGTCIRIHWLTVGSVVLYTPYRWVRDVPCYPSGYLMARVLEVRDGEGGLEVKLQVDPSVPFPVKVKGNHPTPTAAELEGVWLPMTSGRILENGSFT